MVGWLRRLSARLCRPWLRPARVLRLTTRPEETTVNCGATARPDVAQGLNLSAFSMPGRVAGLTQLWLDVPWWQLRPRVVQQLAREGWRWCWLGRGEIVVGLPTLLVAYLRAAQIVWQRGRRRLGWERAPRLPPLPTTTKSEVRPGPRRILHYLKTCLQGGVERQAAYLAAEQRRAGYDVRVVYQLPSIAEPDSAHDWFHAAGIAPRCLADVHVPPDLAALPSVLAEQVAALRPVLDDFQPDVLHCWVDDANVAGLWAGCAAGVPAIILTSLGLSPQRCPQVRTPWMRPLYQAGLQRPRVRLVCISDFGIQDYADWLGVPSNRLDRVRIGVPSVPEIAPEARLAFRQGLGIPPESLLVGGLFRLEPDKRPLLFLEVVHRLARAVPGLHALHVGGGSLAGQFDAEVARRSLTGRVHRLGRVENALLPLAACDVMLLTSAAEGTPNVALEAQALGVVPVLTDVGGCRETLADGVTGRLMPTDDVDGMVSVLHEVLTDAAGRRRMAAAGPSFVAEHYGLARFVADFTAVYDAALGSRS